MKLHWLNRPGFAVVCLYGIFLSCYFFIQPGNQTVSSPPTPIDLKHGTNNANLKESHPTQFHPKHFIYNADTKELLQSLTKGCTNCPIKCHTELKYMSSCRGEACLCFKSNPVMNFETHFDNTIIANESLLPYEVMTLDDQLIKDMRELPNAKRSEVTIVPKDDVYTVGEDIHIKLQLYNGFGHKVERGGDDIRVRMFEKSKQMGIAGRVKDYYNGTYIINIPTLWNGTNNVIIYIPYYREERSTLLKWTRQLNAVFYYKASFKKGAKKQSTLCSSQPNIPGYSVTCNMTYVNGNDEWYCGAPPSRNLTCKDVEALKEYHMRDLAITKPEKYLMRSGDTFRVFAEVKVIVKGRERNERHLLPICHRLPKFKTWDLSLPTGYASKKQYFPMYCRINRTNQDFKNCLKNTTLILSGDSTTKNWFTELIPFTQCNLTSGNLGTDPRTKWSIVAECVNRSTNFKMQWKAHNMPISTLNMERSSTDNRLRAKSIGQMLDEIPTEGKHIFVIHINAHLSRNHYYIMRKILRSIATALRRTIGRNKELFVAIKGPSMFIRRWKPAMNDFNCPFFEKIMMEEFYEFRERVVYLDIWDMNMAYGEKDLHPKDPMLWNMLRLLFGYACS